MDFRDSPDEAEFRGRLRAWLAENNPHLPASSTSDEYWERQPDWHRSLHEGGFFGITWPEEYGGHAMPSAYDVIVDEELARAGRTAVSESRLPRPRASSITRTTR